MDKETVLHLDQFIYRFTKLQDTMARRLRRERGSGSVFVPPRYTLRLDLLFGKNWKVFRRD